MSMCAHCTPSATNSLRNTPATSMPANLWELMLARSATVDFRSSLSSSGSGIGHPFSPSRWDSVATRSRNSSLPITPGMRAPRATVCAPVSVEVSIR